MDTSITRFSVDLVWQSHDKRKQGVAHIVIDTARHKIIRTPNFLAWWRNKPIKSFDTYCKKRGWILLLPYKAHAQIIASKHNKSLTGQRKSAKQV